MEVDMAHSNQRISINNTEPTEYTFSGRIFVESTGYAWGRILLFMDDEDGNSTEIASGDEIKTKGQWVYYEKTVIVPANTDKINLRIGLYHQTNNATAWFDDLKIVKGNLSRTTIVEESNYYPFGLKHKGYNNVTNSLGNSTAQKFGYNGVELEESLGLNLMEMDVRSYDPAIARFTSIDPVIHYSNSTYTAFDNNPTYWADPSGADSVYNSETGQYVINGKEVTFDEALNYVKSGGNSDGKNNNKVDNKIINTDKKELEKISKDLNTIFNRKFGETPF